MVDGVATADTYVVKDDEITKEIAKKDYLHVRDDEGNVVQKDVDKDLIEKQVLTDGEILEVKNLVKKSSEFLEDIKI